MYKGDENLEQNSSSRYWYCVSCKTRDIPPLDNCPFCGAERELYGIDIFTKEELAKEFELDLTPVRKKPKHKIGIKLCIAFASTLALAAVGITVGVVATKPWEKRLYVDKHHWKYTQTLEELRTFYESGWSVPPDAVITSQELKYHHTEQVADGYSSSEVMTDLGISVVTEKAYREVDVYDWWYTYSTERWAVYDTISTEGWDTNPYWGEYTLGVGQRLGSHSQVYQIYASPDDDMTGYSLYTVSHDDWVEIPDGATITCTMFGDSITLNEIIEPEE